MPTTANQWESGRSRRCEKETIRTVSVTPSNVSGPNVEESREVTGNEKTGNCRDLAPPHVDWDVRAHVIDRMNVERAHNPAPYLLVHIKKVEEGGGFVSLENCSESPRGLDCAFVDVDHRSTMI